MSSPIITLTSSSNTNNNISRTSPYKSTRILRDPSFSSYLNGADETFVLKLRGGYPGSIAIPQDHVLHKTEDAEIDVFDAERYFNGAFSSKDDCSEMKHQPRIGTPSIQSESTWNSQNPLLRDQQARRSTKKNILASIGCSCSCRDKNSVSIHNFNGRNISNVGKSRPQDKTSENHFSFPVFNPKTGNQTENRTLNMLNWNSMTALEIHEDGDSDASSDLFEIESLSMQTLDGYAPSEASIEWSVVTASAADFSVLSDSEDLKSNGQKCRKIKEVHKRRRSSILSGCRNHKSVDVARAPETRFLGTERNRHCVVSYT